MKLRGHNSPNTLKPLITKSSSIHNLSPKAYQLNNSKTRHISPDIYSPNQAFSGEYSGSIFSFPESNDSVFQSFDHQFKLFPQKSDLPKLSSSRNSQFDQLENWLEKMKLTHVPELDSIIRQNLVPRTEITSKVEQIYLTALKEIIKQVGGQSQLKGELLSKVLFVLRYIWSKYPQHLSNLLEKEKEFFEIKTQEIEENFQNKIEKYKQRYRLSQIKIRKLEEEKEQMANDIDILRKSAIDYRSEVSQLVKYGFKPNESIAIQVDLNSDWLSSSLTKTISRYNTMREGAMKGKIVAKEDLQRIESKNYTKEKLTSEIMKVFGNSEISPDFDLEALVDTVCKQTNNINDWIEGFRLGFNLAGKVIVRTSTLKLPSFSNKLEISSISKGSRVRSGRSEREEAQPAGQIMRSILTMKEEMLHTYAKNTQKKILKHVVQSLYTSFGKKFSYDYTMADLLFQELMNRYNVRKIAERKLKELIVGCILYSNDNTRIRMFASALGCSCYYKLRNYSVEGCEIYIKLYDFMIYSKTGIILDNSDPLLVENYPLIRANETVKIVFSPFLPFDILNSLFISIKKLSEVDPNHINKEGVIKLDLFIDTCMNVYEDYHKAVEKGVKFAVKSITEVNYITKGEALVLFRHMVVDKKDSIKAIFLQNNEVDFEDFEFFCIENGFLLEDDVLKVFESCEKDWKVVEAELQGYEMTFEKVLGVDVEGMNEEEWRYKFEEMKFMLKGRRNERGLYMWHVMKKELEWLKSVTKVLGS